jgi:hypothetical protein
MAKYDVELRFVTLVYYLSFVKRVRGWIFHKAVDIVCQLGFTVFCYLLATRLSILSAARLTVTWVSFTILSILVTSPTLTLSEGDIGII